MKDLMESYVTNVSNDPVVVEALKHYEALQQARMSLNKKQKNFIIETDDFSYANMIIAESEALTKLKKAILDSLCREIVQTFYDMQ